MNKTLVLEGSAALSAMDMIAEARTTWPILNQVTDEEVLIILIASALTKEVPQ